MQFYSPKLLNHVIFIQLNWVSFCLIILFDEAVEFISLLISVIVCSEKQKSHWIFLWLIVLPT
jgi:hypothetical protein